MREMTYAAAVADALRYWASIDSKMIVIGEGVVDPAPVFGTLGPVREVLPDSRYIEAPTSENAIVGIAAGAAMAGLKPVVTFHRVEFSLLAMEQIVNVVAKMRWMSNGHYAVPVLIRLVIGRGWGQGAVHGQSLESMFAAVPGLRVIMPATPSDAYHQTVAALRGFDPVVSIEHRWCYGTQGEVPDTEGTPWLEPERMDANGTTGHVTVVATSYMVLEAMRAAAAVRAADGLRVELFNLRAISPLDATKIIESTRRTGRLLVVDTGHRSYGIGAELVARVTEDARYSGWQTRVIRLGAASHPLPSSRFLAKGYYPSAGAIAGAILDLAGKVTGDDLSAQLDAAAQPIDQPFNQHLGGPF